MAIKQPQPGPTVTRSGQLPAAPPPKGIKPGDAGRTANESRGCRSDCEPLEAEAFKSVARALSQEHVPPAEMAGCSARMLEAAVAALYAVDAAEG